MKPRLKWILSSVVLLGIVFCLSFFYFSRVQRQAAAEAAKTPDKLLPQTRLIDSTGAQADDQMLRKGNVVLVFLSTDCKACDNELDFLGQAYQKRGDVKFYGVVSFGAKDSLKETEQKYPF